MMASITPTLAPSSSDAGREEAEALANSPAAENPVGDTFNIVVSVPESITIRMVDASALADYEVWVLIASIVGSGCVGFIVAYFQAVDAKAASQAFAGWTVVLFIAVFVISVVMAGYKRQSLAKKGRSIKLKTSGVSTR